MDQERQATETVMEEIALATLVAAQVEWAKEPGSIAEVDARVDALLLSIGALEAEAKKNTAVATARKEQIQAWLDDENGHLESSVDFLTRKIQDLTRSYDFGRKRSRNLPAGTFGYRRASDTLTIEDPTKAIEFSKAQGLSIRVKESPDGHALLEWVKTKGEVPDGTLFKQGVDTFYVKPRPDAQG